MKTRYGYVGNSSSCSFIIDKTLLTRKQIESVIDHTNVGKSLGMEYTDESWQIWNLEELIVGDTGMDNFDMETFLQVIEVPKDAIEWDTYNGYTYGKISSKASEVISKLRTTYKVEGG